ncbi:hypothetical protein [Burkholderia gladioli]|uniref:hypothetical protein n=1 Tax=Burkholderia gladioli TaxID=28095 RepID=UPI00163E3307|nr:hypothetical protein [Burkholderia gladioli]
MTNNTTADLDRDITHLIDSSENGIARVPRETLVRLRELFALQHSPIRDEQREAARKRVAAFMDAYSILRGADQEKIHSINFTPLLVADLRALLTSPRAGVPAPKGWKLVPIEPTDEMVEAGHAEYERALIGNRKDIGAAFLRRWAAMLDAAPAAPVAEISAGTEPNPSKESGQSEAVISARGFDDQAVAADGAAMDQWVAETQSEFVSALILAICELPDRHSPEGEPGAMVANSDEIAHCVDVALEKTGLSISQRAAVSPATAEDGGWAAFEPWFERAWLLNPDKDFSDRIRCKAWAWKTWKYLRGEVPATAEKVYYGGSVEAGPVAFDETPTADERAARDDGFFAGVCVALQVITAFDQGVMWAELVRACGTDELLQYAAHVEPEEWQLAGFEKYAFNELRKKKPKAAARASQAAALAEAREPFPYQKTFDAIAAATSITAGGHVSISVEAFRKAFGAVPADAGEAVLTAAARDVLAERARQVSVEGWTLEHDDQYTKGELAQAASLYAVSDLKRGDPPLMWPWHANWWKPTTPRRNRVKATALMLAEIERLDRAEAREQGAQGGKGGEA